jgi:hypothetical protein
LINIGGVSAWVYFCSAINTGNPDTEAAYIYKVGLDAIIRPSTQTTFDGEAVSIQIHVARNLFDSTSLASTTNALHAYPRSIVYNGNKQCIYVLVTWPLNSAAYNGGYYSQSIILYFSSQYANARLPSSAYVYTGSTGTTSSGSRGTTSSGTTTTSTTTTILNLPSPYAGVKNQRDPMREKQIESVNGIQLYNSVILGIDTNGYLIIITESSSSNGVITFVDGSGNDYTNTYYTTTGIPISLQMVTTGSLIGNNLNIYYTTKNSVVCVSCTSTQITNDRKIATGLENNPNTITSDSTFQYLYVATDYYIYKMDMNGTILNSVLKVPGPTYGITEYKSKIYYTQNDDLYECCFDIYNNNSCGGIKQGGGAIIPKIMYLSKMKKEKKPKPTHTYLLGGAVILSPSSYALPEN